MYYVLKELETNLPVLCVDVQIKKIEKSIVIRSFNSPL